VYTSRKLKVVRGRWDGWKKGGLTAATEVDLAGWLVSNRLRRG